MTFASEANVTSGDGAVQVGKGCEGVLARYALAAQEAPLQNKQHGIGGLLDHELFGHRRTSGGGVRTARRTRERSWWAVNGTMGLPSGSLPLPFGEKNARFCI